MRTSYDYGQVGLTSSKNGVVFMKGLPVLELVIVAVKTTVNVSASLTILSNQLINIEVELNVMNDVLPPTEPVTDIV